MINRISSVFIVLYFSITYFLCGEIDDKMRLLKKEEARIMNALAGASMTSLIIQANDKSEAAFKFGSLDNFYSFAARGDYKDFILSNGQRPLLQVDKDNNILMFTSNVVARSGLNFNGDLKIRGVPQWKLVIEEDFLEGASGWTNNTVTECGGVKMLGGYCQFGGGEVFKIFNNLPSHKTVRIQATYHFIDAWDTESGFMRINNGKDGEMQYAWIERYSAFSGNHGINICGGQWPEGKFSSPIDVVIPHKHSSIKIGFGASIEQDACDESFGVSGIRIFII
jgi:hypothetical protein